MSDFFDDDQAQEYDPNAVAPENMQPAATTAEYDQTATYNQDQNNFNDSGYVQERAQLMAEEPVSLPAEEPEPLAPVVTPMQVAESKQQTNHSMADKRLKEQTQRVRGQLLDEIKQFNYQTDASNAAKIKSFEEEEAEGNVFSVRNPVKVKDTFGEVTKYTVIGQDSEGRFDIQRRFKEFDALYKVLIERWPGCYIPAIPEKALDNKDDSFVELRRSLLERFLRECSKYQWLIDTDEFKIFSRQAGEVDGVLFKLPRQTPSKILEKYRLNFQHVTELNIEDTDQSMHKEKIQIFQALLGKASQSMNKDRKLVEQAKTSTDATYEHYKQLYGNFIKFEDVALEYFHDGSLDERLLTHPTEKTFEQDLNEIVSTLQNPWAETQIWIRGELLDITGMIVAMQGRDLVLSKQKKTEAKKAECQAELDKLVAGKTTLKSFWKSKGAKEGDILKHQASIEQCNQDISEYMKLVNFVTAYHGVLAIDKFKRDKTDQYVKMLNLVGVREVHNSFHHCQINQRILEIQERNAQQH